MAKPSVLLLDIETAPNLLTSWGLKIYGGYLSPENIVQERTIICASWKWLDQEKIYSSCVNAKTPLQDINVLHEIRFQLRQADAVIAHNGDEFDLPWIMTRSIHHNLPPLPPIVQIDTRKIAKKKFNFNSNKLEYLAQFLGVGTKLKTEYDLWKACLRGEEKALQKMVQYNRHDVVLLEGIYLRLAPFVPAQINARLFMNRPVCPYCAHEHVTRQGTAYTLARAYARYQCQACHHWFRDSASIPKGGK